VLQPAAAVEDEEAEVERIEAGKEPVYSEAA